MSLDQVRGQEGLGRNKIPVKGVLQMPSYLVIYINIFSMFAYFGQRLKRTTFIVIPS